MKITIGGMPGSGKSVVGRFLAEQLGCEFYSMGGIRRELAKRRGLTINEYNSLPENTDKETDDFQKELGKTKEDFVIEGRLSFHFVPDSFKIYFDCDVRVATERIHNDPRETEEVSDSLEEASEMLKARVENDRERYRRHYGVDAYDSSQFDYVLDTTSLTLDEVKEKVLEAVRERMKG